MNKYKYALKEYNKNINEEIKGSNNLEIKNMYKSICYYRVWVLHKNKVITNKKYKVLTKLLDAYFEIERNILENYLMKEKLSNRLIKIEAILSSYHILDEINITKYIKKDILRKVKK